jgi:Skp family chaperone for outer membrane proteins
MERLKLYTLPVIIALTALSVSASAAFYSVTGLSKLFAGARLEVIIMAGSLEVAKLVIASLLYQYRKTIPSVLKYYLTTAAVVLVLITSMGIYGFLSAAYQETATKAGTIDAQIALIETKRDNVTSQLQSYNTEKVNIDKAVADLRAGLANNIIQYKDKDGNLITTTSSATRRALENQLDQAIERQNSINTKVDGLNEQLFAYETEIVEVSTSSGLASELGPLKYLAGITGVSMDKIVNILLLIIVFVFDPLAISLVIAANFAFAQIKPKVAENIYGEREAVSDELPAEHQEEPVKVNTEQQEDWVVVDDEREPGMYYQGKRIIKTPDRTGQKWTVELEGAENKRVKVWKDDIEFVSYRKDKDDDQTIRYM